MPDAESAPENTMPENIQDKFNKLVGVLQNYAVATGDKRLYNMMEKAGFGLETRPHFGSVFKS